MTRPDEVPTQHDDSALDPRGRDPEAPEPDAVEQSVSADPSDEPPTEVRRGFEVGEWDAVEQSIAVNLDDDYDH